MPHLRLPRVVVAGAIFLGAFSGAASAQNTYPDKTIHVQLGFLAGASSDILSRYYTKKLQDISGQTVVLENKPGLFGLLPGGAVARAKPDGYTVWFTPSIPASRFLVKEPPFNPEADFAPVAPLFQTPMMLSVSGKSDIKSVAELVEHLKKKRGRYGYGSPTTLIATEYFLNQSGLSADGVAYRGASQALPEVENMTLDFIINDAMTAWPLSKAGRMRALAVTTNKRIPDAPDLPTMEEAGMRDYNFDGWWGAFVPAATPPDVVAKLAALLAEINRLPETKKFLESAVASPLFGDAAWMKSQLAQDTETWRRLAKISNLQPQ
jgi:tripartite-type tricarboxylate transporter receptor subunit TctC